MISESFWEQTIAEARAEALDAPAGDTGVEYLLRGLDAPEHYYYRGALWIFCVG